MRRFKIGQKVVCVDDRNTIRNIIKQGNEYTVDGFHCCVGCGEPTIYIKEDCEVIYLQCYVCSHTEDERVNYRESRFAPLEEIESAIENLIEQSNLITK